MAFLPYEEVQYATPAVDDRIHISSGEFVCAGESFLCGLLKERSTNFGMTLRNVRVHPLFREQVTCDTCLMLYFAEYEESL